MTIQTSLLRLIKGTELDEWDHELLLNANWEKIEKEISTGLVNVQWFGATGLEDDSAPIQAAAEHCLLNGGILFFPGTFTHATYAIPATITQLYSDGTIIQGDNAYFKFGNKKPTENLKAGMSYFDAITKSVHVFNGGDWIDLSNLSSTAHEALSLRSPDGSIFRLTVGNDGALTTTKITV